MGPQIKAWLLLAAVTGARAAMSGGVHSVVLPPAPWSPWSPWSPCSRSCGSEGLQSRRRVCLSSRGCEGSSHAWRVCALSACEAGASSSLRAEQCAAHNTIAHEGSLHRWVPAEQAAAPCSLDCLASDVTDRQLVARLGERVEDGTRCGGATQLKLCLDGVCEEMGCDLELRTGARLDRCGVCGGNGSSCSAPSNTRYPRHDWVQVASSRCSASCGGGLAMAVTSCVDTVTNTTAAEELCDETTRPTELFIKCNLDKCPPRWEVSEWTVCRAECNGVKTRTVECVSDEDGAKLLVHESQCPGSRPESELPCTNTKCPSWYAGEWSGCSVSCGDGIKQRDVICRNESGELSAALRCAGEKPPDTEPCHRKCTQVLSSRVSEASKGWEKLDRSQDEGGEDAPEDHTIVIQDEYNDEVVEDTADEEEDDADFAASGSVKKIVGTSPNFIVDAWSPCSASCGEGMRFRKVECKIFMEFSKTVATLPDRECPGLKPAETELCVTRPSCEGATQEMMADQDRASITHETLPSLQLPETLALLGDEARPGPEEGPSYAWKIAGFTTCTASCLGGLQESIVICVEEEKETPVAPYFCDPDNRLEIEVRTCNENPCPPRWNVSDFTACSQSCGGGTQTRTVQCIQEVAHGDHNIIQLAEAACPQPPPRAQQFCNVIDCPPAWQAEPWTKCSRRCGGGVRYRKVRCQQLLSLGQLIDKAETSCRAGAKPGAEEDCSTEPCKYVANPKIRAKQDQRFVQSDPAQTAVKLKVGGTASVYAGTTIKISCPVRHYDKSRITWAHGSLLYHSGKVRARHTRVSVSSKGCVKIKNIQMEDSGTYTCMASKSSATIQLTVLPVEARTQRPGYKDKSRAGDKSSKDKYKDKWGSSKQNRVGTEENLVEKPSKSGKWNSYREDEAYYYWDSINNHVQRGAKDKSKSSLKLADMALSKTEKKKKRRRNRQKKKRKHPKHPQKSESPLTWQTGTWSMCSKSCGGGLQYRQVQCVMQFSERNSSQDVPAAFCEGAGVRRPSLQRECGLETCHAWIKSPWSPCHAGECLARNTGLRTRRVQCILDRRSVVEDSWCGGARPRDSQPCHNTECAGVWVLGEWSPCSVTCGKGRRLRSVTCEWLRGGAAPESECRHEEKPLAVLDCFGPACHQWPDFSAETHLLEPRIVLSPARDGRDTSGCEDTSKFCGLVRSAKMCAAPNIRDQCCKTCQQHV